MRGRGGDFVASTAMRTIFVLRKLQECLLEEQCGLKGRALSSALKKKAVEIWGQATCEQKEAYKGGDDGDAARCSSAVVNGTQLNGDDDGDNGENCDDDDERDPDFKSSSGADLHYKPSNIFANDCLSIVNVLKSCEFILLPSSVVFFRQSSGDIFEAQARLRCCWQVPPC